MKIQLTTIISVLAFISACNDKNSSIVSDKEYVQLVIKEDNTTPTIDIKYFTLITNNPEEEIDDAKEIMQIKRKIPLAMQTKDSSLWNEILAEKFTARDEDAFYKNRNELIKDVWQEPGLLIR